MFQVQRSFKGNVSLSLLIAERAASCRNCSQSSARTGSANADKSAHAATSRVSLVMPISPFGLLGREYYLWRHIELLIRSGITRNSIMVRAGPMRLRENITSRNDVTTDSRGSNWQIGHSTLMLQYLRWSSQYELNGKLVNLPVRKLAGSLCVEQEGVGGLIAAIETKSNNLALIVDASGKRELPGRSRRNQ